jgi:hypothetical protein
VNRYKNLKTFITYANCHVCQCVTPEVQRDKMRFIPYLLTLKGRVVNIYIYIYIYIYIPPALTISNSEFCIHRFSMILKINSDHF